VIKLLFVANKAV